MTIFFLCSRISRLDLVFSRFHVENVWCHMVSYMAMGQNLLYHIWVDENPFTIYFDVHIWVQRFWPIAIWCHVSGQKMPRAWAAHVVKIADDRRREGPATSSFPGESVLRSIWRKPLSRGRSNYHPLGNHVNHPLIDGKSSIFPRYHPFIDGFSIVNHPLR